jgi:hypothetical protein
MHAPGGYMSCTALCTCVCLSWYLHRMMHRGRPSARCFPCSAPRTAATCGDESRQALYYNATMLPGCSQLNNGRGCTGAQGAGSVRNRPHPSALLVITMTRAKASRGLKRPGEGFPGQHHQKVHKASP